MTDPDADDPGAEPGREPGGELGAELERLAIDLARGAAGVVTAAAGDRLRVDAKSTATDLVTQVDRASERWLTDELARRRPDDAVLGEEGASRPGTSGVRWVLDPIDGTVNFVLGLPQYAVSVAAELDGVVVAGAVCNPATGELFHARAGGGAHLIDTTHPADPAGARSVRLGGPREIPLERAVVGTGFAYDARVRARQAEVAARLLPRVADLRRLGAAALDLCFVAAGRLDAHYEVGLNEWDYAAGGLVAREAGCTTSGGAGRDGSRRLHVTAGPGLIGDLERLLDELGADVLDDDAAR